MRVRTVDQDFNGNQLELFWGGNGDVYVTIYENESSEEARDNPIGRPVTVRVGMGGSGQLHIDPSVIIVAENIKDSIQVIGRKIISDLPYVVKKKDVIGDNEKLHIAVFDSNEIMQYDFYIYNAWIQDVNEETNTIVLNCDHIS